MTRVLKCFRSSKTTTALPPSPTHLPLCSLSSTTNRVIQRRFTSFVHALRGFTSFVHGLRGIFRSFLIHQLQFLRFSRSCSSCAPFTHATRVSSISLHPCRRIFLRPLSIRFSWTQHIYGQLHPRWLQGQSTSPSIHSSLSGGGDGCYRSRWQGASFSLGVASNVRVQRHYLPLAPFSLRKFLLHPLPLQGQRSSHQMSHAHGVRS